MTQGLYQTVNEHRLVFISFAASVLLIYLSLYNSIFGVAAFLFHLMLLCTIAPSEYVILLYALLPWAYVYKISGIATSLFSILVIATVLRNMLNLRRMDKDFIMPLVLFILIVVMQAKMNNRTMLVMFIKLIFNLILLYQMSSFYKPGQLKPVLLVFAFSVILSSIVAQYTPNKALFLNKIKVEGVLVAFKYARFTGLQNDPNYYNASLVISLLGLCYLYIKRDIGAIFFPLALICVYFGFLTYSKSFFLLLLMWFALLVYYAFQKKRRMLGTVLLLLSIIAVMFIFSGKVEVINVLMDRFNDPNGITTGRTDTWKTYGEYLFENVLALLFGNGFGTMVLNAHASHNTYIDLIYCFGIVGSICFLSTIYACFLQNRRKGGRIFACVFSVFILAIYAFLSGITLCELPFILFLVFMFYYDEETVLAPKYVVRLK